VKILGILSMLNSFHLIDATGEILIEKVWRKSKSVKLAIQYFWKEVHSYSNPEEVPPILQYVNHYLISIYRDGNFLVAITTTETSPLLIIEFLNRVNNIFFDYFGDTTESTLKDNFSTAYQLLEEMMDFGYPLMTEPNVLRSMIKPPSMLSRFQSISSIGVSNISDVLPDGTISNMPWRKTGVSYSQNEIFIDIIEEIDAIVDARGGVVTSEVSGVLATNCRLSGVPDCTLIFKDPTLIDDCSFHPCVRFKRFDRDKVLSFVPPDGVFELMRYRMKKSGHMTAPVYVQPMITLDQAKGTGKLTMNLGQKTQTCLVETKMSTSMVVEDIVVIIPFSKAVKSGSFVADVGTVFFHEATKVLKWTIGILQRDQYPQISGDLVMHPNTSRVESPIIQLQWKVINASFSGLSIASLVVSSEPYKPFKGVRSIAKSGKYQLRSI